MPTAATLLACLLAPIAPPPTAGPAAPGVVRAQEDGSGGLTVRGRVLARRASWETAFAEDADAPTVPVAGARVLAFQDDFVELRTGEDGAFEVTGLEPGRVRLDVTAAFASAELSDPLRAASDPPTGAVESEGGALVEAGASGVEIVLDGPFLAAGRVVDGDGAPVTRFRLVARSGYGRPRSPVARRDVERVFHGPDGAFELILPGCDWRLQARAEGRVDSRSVWLADFGLATEELRLRLPAQPHLFGRLLPPAGRSAAGGRVHLVPAGGGRERTAAVDADGRYGFDVALLGPAHVHAEVPARAGAPPLRAARRPVGLRAGERRPNRRGACSGRCGRAPTPSACSAPAASRARRASSSARPTRRSCSSCAERG